MIFYWVRDRIQKNHFYLFWEEGKENLEDYVTKYHPIRGVEKCQKVTSMRMALAEMGQQPPTPAATENTATKSIVKGTVKQKIS